MTAAEAHAAAAAEGLTLLRAENRDGLQGREPQQRQRQQAIQGETDGTAGATNQLGVFATAEEAALAVARASSGRRASRRRCRGAAARATPRR